MSISAKNNRGSTGRTPAGTAEPDPRAAAKPPLPRFSETRRVRPTYGGSPECAEETHNGDRRSARDAGETDKTRKHTINSERIDIMYCRKCGTQIAEDVTFCTNCGERVAPPAVTIEEQTAQTAAVTEMPQAQETPEVQPAPEAAAAEQPEAYAAPQDAPAQPVEAENTILPPIITAAPEKTKTDFGKGALAFCLVIIGLLAISTGIFAGLYFSLL